MQGVIAILCGCLFVLHSPAFSTVLPLLSPNHVDSSVAASKVSVEELLERINSNSVRRKQLLNYEVSMKSRTKLEVAGTNHDKESYSIRRYQNGVLVSSVLDGKAQDESKRSSASKNSSESGTIGIDVEPRNFHWSFAHSSKTGTVSIVGKPKPSAPPEVTTVRYTFSTQSDDILSCDIESTKPAEGVSGNVRIHLDYTNFRTVFVPAVITAQGEGTTLLVISFKLNLSSQLEYK